MRAVIAVYVRHTRKIAHDETDDLYPLLDCIYIYITK